MGTLTPLPSLSNIVILWVYFDPGGVLQEIVGMKGVESLTSDFLSSFFKSYQGNLVAHIINLNVSPYMRLTVVFAVLTGL